MKRAVTRGCCGSLVLCGVLFYRVESAGDEGLVSTGGEGDFELSTCVASASDVVDGGCGWRGASDEGKCELFGGIDGGCGSVHVAPEVSGGE